MKIGIYSGSFNPVHLGHVALADFLVKEGFVDEVWLIRSPQNPLKRADGQMDNEARLAMLRLAIEGHRGLKVCTIEDEMPLPNYTISTLRELQHRHPGQEFHLIVGADNWLIFRQWKDWDVILRDFHLIVYPRPGYPLPDIDANQYPTVRIADAPQYDISSTQIRQKLAQGESLAGWVDPKVEQYLRYDTAQDR